MEDEISYYELLQVSENACADVIQAAYRTLQRQFHPDAGGTGELASALNKAKDFLLDPIERNRYDATRKISAARKHGLDKSSSSGNAASERTYAFCVNCKTRNLVNYHDLDQTKCFGCDMYLIPRAKEVQVADPKPSIPPENTERDSWWPRKTFYALGLVGIGYVIMRVTHWGLVPSALVVCVGAYALWLVKAAREIWA